jgi:formate hydrogenlyase subunit 3/multisubunit Na+/H+ antiporter MnhD subunit
MEESFLPIILFTTPIVGIIFVFLFRNLPIKYIREITTLFFQLLTLIIGIIIVSVVFQGKTLTAANEAFFVDGLSALMVILVPISIILITIYSIKYIIKEKERGIISNKRITLYYSLILLFTGTMMWTVTTNHLVMLYVAIEGTTLASSLLVAFYRTRASLEAGYKYVLLVVVGITLALFGIVLIFAAAVPHLPAGSRALLLTDIGRVSKLIPSNIALLAVIFMIAGFGTKAGLVPFHAWLPDAHSEAPSPISALLSGLIIKIGAYALARTVTIFTGQYHSIIVFIAIMASAGMLIGIFLAWSQDDLKRLLAFHSVSQICYVFEGLGLGTYMGIYGGLYHLVNHTFFKGLLFLCAGCIMYATKGKRKISELGGLGSKMPITAFCFFIGALAMGGVPFLNGFMSKFTIFLAAGQQKLYWAAAISIFTGFLTLGCMVHAGYMIFWKKPATQSVHSNNPEEIREVPFLMWGPMLVLAGLCFLLGMYPQIVYPFLDRATRAILTIWAG